MWVINQVNVAWGYITSRNTVWIASSGKSSKFSIHHPGLANWTPSPPPPHHASPLPMTPNTADLWQDCHKVPHHTNRWPFYHLSSGMIYGHINVGNCPRIRGHIIAILYTCRSVVLMAACCTFHELNPTLAWAVTDRFCGDVDVATGWGVEEGDHRIICVLYGTRIMYLWSSN